MDHDGSDKNKIKVQISIEIQSLRLNLIKCYSNAVALINAIDAKKTFDETIYLYMYFSPCPF